MNLSLVIPIYNEEESLPALKQGIQEWEDTLNDVSLEVVLVDDGSSDASWQMITDWAKSSPDKIVPCKFSRNFGHQAAITCGMDIASGEAVVIIDADLQDPLSIINDLLAQYKQGYDIVHAVRAKRQGESKFKLFTAWVFYRYMSYVTGGRMPADAGDFKLISRKALDEIKGLRETHRFMRGLSSWVGFRQTSVTYTRDERRYGETKYPLHKMLRLAWEASISFSTAPIKMIALIGLLFACFGIAYGAYAFFVAFVAPEKLVRGWTTLIVLNSLFSGFMLIALSLVGEYVAKIYETTKQRPIYIMDKDESKKT